MDTDSMSAADKQWTLNGLEWTVGSRKWPVDRGQ